MPALNTRGGRTAHLGGDLPCLLPHLAGVSMQVGLLLGEGCDLVGAVGDELAQLVGGLRQAGALEGEGAVREGGPGPHFLLQPGLFPVGVVQRADLLADAVGLLLGLARAAQEVLGQVELLDALLVRDVAGASSVPRMAARAAAWCSKADAFPAAVAASLLTSARW
ncbi:hypothetical protein J7E99_40360, partial [Streptomyces sp. ISL-44]|uniref:hypothetical protein n=1 Tax=Streptomyces sp. ISL-44 TaxID=2819184 RepID=UPI001BEBA10D